jgi:hypothetical protein
MKQVLTEGTTPEIIVCSFVELKTSNMLPNASIVE